MAVLALVLIAVWLLLVAGLRTLIQVRRTGEASAPRLRDRPGSPQWWARLLSGVGFACAVAAPLAELAGLDPIPLPDPDPGPGRRRRAGRPGHRRHLGRAAGHG